MTTSLAELHALAQGIEGLVVWLRRTAPSELSVSTLTALARLEREGPTRVSELARREAMTQPGVTILVNRLQQAGLAERVPDPSDGRASLVRITEAGRSLLAERHEIRARALFQRLTELDAADQRAILAAGQALQRLVPDGAQPNRSLARTSTGASA